MSQVEVNKKSGTTDDGNGDCHGASTHMLLSPEAAESDAPTCNGNITLNQPARKKTFSDLPQELRDMIWKEVLLDEDDLNIYSRCHVDVRAHGLFAFMYAPQHRPRKKLPPDPGLVLLSTRPPALAHLCHDAREAALKHHERDPVRNGSPALRGELDSPSWLSRSALLLAKCHQDPGEKKGLSPDDIRCDPFKSQSLLLHMGPHAWDHKQFGRDPRLVRAYEILRNARDDQVMVRIPWLRVSAYLSWPQLSRCKFLFDQGPDCIHKLPDGDLHDAYYQNVYVEAHDSDMLRCIIQAADRGFEVHNMKDSVDLSESLTDKAFTAEVAKNALAFLQDLWVEESRKASREEEVMPKVKLVIDFAIIVS
ncbi:hypothetical protein B0H65DRAFT_302406 [Neurospora tetraspora]|uniref:2EXR domain-containing protein n=1 Tax=Neurospora tetraspora TaxID=94610 RepID=A0AAE0J9E8_9PEZI|nr:hypothetical protein B0H65DRAFT_302406 [Neurospora tetraspora]